VIGRVATVWTDLDDWEGNHSIDRPG
jgi:hypothetical protein